MYLLVVLRNVLTIALTLYTYSNLQTLHSEDIYKDSLFTSFGRNHPLTNSACGTGKMA